MAPPSATGQVSMRAARTLMRLLQGMGLWPIGKPHSRDDSQHPRRRRSLAHYYGYLLHLPLTFTYNTLMWIEALTRWERADDILYISITELGMMALAVNFWRVEHAAWHFMHEISYGSSYALRNEEERECWRQQQWLFERIAICYIGGGVGVLLTAFGATLLVNGYNLPYDYWLPFEWHNAHNYWYAYGYELVAMSLTCISNVTMDMMLCYYLFHVALLYKLIGIRLMALQHLREPFAVAQLIAIIELHKKVKRLTSQCESLVSFPIMVQILLSALILCLSAYRLQNMQISENPGQFLAMLQFASVLTLQIFLPCYFANEITINSDALTTCIYSSNWEEFSPATRKQMNLFMELLKQPARIKAGNFFIVGLPIFTKTMNNAYSLLALLLNMSE
ncbi:odorant receptor 94a-like [Anastrepha ludens]|uniref:odorant receptor 94a-like n=1 Tax=Anastrepha ludens TaxID=28586 RepID=UPI0023AFDABC|nr:odorant receptor 94a-like [Anastrepha ludens]